MLIFSFALIPALCVNAGATDTGSTEPETYMVDLSGYFNKDIFASVGETVDDGWGFPDVTYFGTDTNTSDTKNVGINSAKVKELLNEDGILSANEVFSIKKYADKTNDSVMASYDDIKACVSATPFDLSNIDKDKNALVQGEYKNDTFSTVTISQNEAGTVFSGKQSDYLLILSAAVRGNQTSVYTLTYTDGTSKEYTTEVPWAGDMTWRSDSNGIYQAKTMGEKLYASDELKATEIKNLPAWNEAALVVYAIPTGGKIIKSIARKTAGSVGFAPVLAMTEILYNEYRAKKAEFEKLDGEIGNNIEDSDSYFIAKAYIEDAEYLEQKGYEFSQTVLAKVASLEKQFNALKPHAVDLSEYFNKDIFASVGESVDENWGYYDKVDSNSEKVKIGINLSSFDSVLNEKGILSDAKVANIVTGNKDATKEDDIMSLLAETPFDLSAIKGNGSNAIVQDRKDGNEAVADPASVKIEKGFSGKASDYLIVLSAIGHADEYATYTLEFTDGTSETAAINYSWAGVYEDVSVLNAYKLRVVSGKTADPEKIAAVHKMYNSDSLLATAIPTNGKIIKSVTKTKTSAYGTAPVLAMTEVTAVAKLADTKTELETLLADITEVTDLTAQAKAEKTIEKAEFLENAGYTLSEETTAKIATLSKQVNALKPYFVDLTSVFNKDIFASENEAVNINWGFSDMVRFGSDNDNGYEDKEETVGINSATVKAKLDENGIYAGNEVVAIANKLSSNGENTTLASYEEVKTYASATPFDLSNIDNEKNALVQGTYKNDAVSTVTVSQNENGTVFSGKPSKYLLVLTAVGRANQTSTYKITYTDGTTSTHSAHFPWIGQLEADKTIAFNTGEKLYSSDGNTVKSSYATNPIWDSIALAASAIPTNGKTIASVEKTDDAAYGFVPVLAMTEIPVNYSDLASDMEYEYSDITVENADEVIKATDAAIELYNRGYSDVDEEFYTIYCADNAKARAVKYAVNGIYAENSFKQDSENVTANLKLTNVTADEKNYILVIAAYSGNGEKLENVVCGEAASLSSDDIAKEASIKIPVNNKANLYKVFVWESLNSLKPIAAFAK